MTDNQLKIELERVRALLTDDHERDFEARELIEESGIFRVHTGPFPIEVFECGSTGLEDTPKSLYRALFLLKPQHSLCFARMYKGSLIQVAAPNNTLAASIEFFKYELALYFYATKEHIQGNGSSIISGLPGADNGVRFSTEVAAEWFSLLTDVLNREWEVYSGNDFIV